MLFSGFISIDITDGCRATPSNCWAIWSTSQHRINTDILFAFFLTSSCNRWRVHSTVETKYLCTDWQLEMVSFYFFSNFFYHFLFEFCLIHPSFYTRKQRKRQQFGEILVCNRERVRASKPQTNPIFSIWTSFSYKNIMWN